MVWTKLKAEGKEAREAWVEIRAFRRARMREIKEKGAGFFFKTYWKLLLITFAIIVIVVLMAYWHDPIVEAFEPHRQAIVDYPGSWAVPIAVLVILSIPPMLGHELVMILCGVIWSLGIGFGIAAAGTILGDSLCFLIFRFKRFKRYGEKMEHKNVQYECLATLMRRRGIGIICCVRLSAIPSHLVTAIQSTIGINFWIYELAIFASLPKQLILVFLGALFYETGTGPKGQERKLNKGNLISFIVLLVTLLITFGMVYFIYVRARRMYPEVMRLREARAAAANTAASGDIESGETRDGGDISVSDKTAGDEIHLDNSHAIAATTSAGEVPYMVSYDPTQQPAQPQGGTQGSEKATV